MTMVKAQHTTSAHHLPARSRARLTGRTYRYRSVPHSRSEPPIMLPRRAMTSPSSTGSTKFRPDSVKFSAENVAGPPFPPALGASETPAMMIRAASPPNTSRLRIRRNCVVSSICSIVLLHQSEVHVFETPGRADGIDAHARHDKRLVEFGRGTARRGGHDPCAAQVNRLHAVHHAQCLFGPADVVHYDIVSAGAEQ